MILLRTREDAVISEVARALAIARRCRGHRVESSRSFAKSIGRFVVLVALFGPAACGTDVEEARGDVGAFCDSYISMLQASDSEKELTTLAENGEALFDDVQASTPDEVSEPVGVVVDATRRAAAEKTPRALQSREVSKASDAVVSYMFDNCRSATKLDVVAVDHAFEGVPHTLSAGLVALRFTNDGDHYHEIIVFRRNDGVTQSFDEILELPEEHRRRLMTFVGAANAERGESAKRVFKAEAGEHIALCFERVSATGEARAGEGEGEGEGEGSPHWAEGQRSEFRVVE